MMAFAFSWIQCKTDIDNEPPSIALNNFSASMSSGEICGQLETNVFFLQSGEVFSFQATFSDNIGLSQYKIDIHQNFDCHGHGEGATPALALPNRENSTEDWFLIQIDDLEGREQIRQFALSVPDHVTAGNYHFSIQVLDEAGNDTQDQDIFNLKIRNIRDTLAPSLQVDLPKTSRFKAKRGEKLRFKGMVKDDKDLGEGGNGMVFVSYRNLTSGNLFATQTYLLFTAHTGDTADFDLLYTVPTFLNKGPYQFILSAFDGVRNAATPFLFEIEIE
jgi:hypothetical protein